MPVSAVAYVVTAATFFGLWLLTLTVWRSRVRGSHLTLAFALQAIWAGLTAIPGLFGVALPSLQIAVELARTFSWLLVLVTALAPILYRNLPTKVLSVAAAGGVVLIVAVAVSPFFLTRDVVEGTLATTQRWGGLLAAIAGLVLVEQFARNSREDARWRLKYVWIAIGLILMSELATWSLALLGAGTDGLIWSARAVVNALSAALFLVAIRRLRRWGADLFESAGALFFNTTLLLTGGYVLLMALASYLIQEKWSISGSLVEAVFIGAAMVLLAVALFSDQFRAWTRVIAAKFLRPYRFDYREVWLRLTRALTEGSDVPLHDRVTVAMASFVNSGSGSLWVREPEGAYRRVGGMLEMSAGFPAIPHDDFLEDLRRRDWIYDLADPRAEPASGRQGGTATAFPPPPAWLTRVVRAWLLVPLICNEQLVGFVVIARPLAPTRLNWERLDILRAAARQVASYLAFEQVALRLGELHQFEALNRLSAFVMHDLRHLVAQLALIVDNAARHRHNPEFIDDALLTIESSVSRMNALMEVLRTGVVKEPERRLEVAELLREVRQRCRYREPDVALDLESPSVEVMANRERLLQALEHLTRNAQESTRVGGSVSLRLRSGPRTARIEIIDDGAGMDPEFVRTRLFKPFDSTKGQQGMGLGAYEAREIVRKLGGTLNVESQIDVGTRVAIELPLAPQLDA